MKSPSQKMQRKLQRMVVIYTTCLASMLRANPPAGMVLIVNEGVRSEQVSESALRDVYTGKKTYWDDGQNIVLVILTAQTDAAVKEVSGMDSTQFKTFWQRFVFSGRGQQPRKAEDAAALVLLVASTKGAIALVPAGTPLKGVKKLEIN